MIQNVGMMAKVIAYITKMKAKVTKSYSQAITEKRRIGATQQSDDHR